MAVLVRTRNVLHVNGGGIMISTGSDPELLEDEREMRQG